MRAAADTAAPGIDAYVASPLFGPGPAQAARRDGHMSRASLTHGVWAVPATSAGPSGTYDRTSGGSGVWAQDGRTVVQAGPEAGAIVSTTVDGAWPAPGALRTSRRPSRP
ncbi:hypothetical protein [Streptomyces sp. NBC_00046]|uniref:hypothetical protein n=1 Tax=unclassified Streptomyces TaxID=2593676 RepID=UPI003245501A